MRNAVLSPLVRRLALFAGLLVAAPLALAACSDGDGTAEPECGNDVVEEDELCDGTDLGGETCISLGYGAGELACQATCLGFDRSGCAGGTVNIGDGDGDGDSDGDGDGDGDVTGGDGDGDGGGDGDGDGDGGGDACVPEEGDLDCDTIPDAQDNCPNHANLNQADLDGDGLGNPCDPDQDGDGYNNEDDCAPFEPEINPGAEEIPDNPIDENCDGEAEGTVTSGPSCPEDCTGTSVDQMLCAMEICYDDLLTSAAAVAPNGDDISGALEAVARYGDADNGLEPTGPSYTVMSTGLVNSPTDHQDPLPGGSPSADPFSDDGFDVYDSVEFTVTLTAPPGAHGFSIDYIFMSQEYEEFVGSDYNDKFYIILNAPETTEGADRIINYAACSDPNAHTDFFIPGEGPYCYIAINSAFSEPCSNPATSLAGTGYEPGFSLIDACGTGGGSSTGWLRTSWTISAGETFDLTFHIHDASDQAYDSAVLLDNFQWQGAGVKPGTEN